MGRTRLYQKEYNRQYWKENKERIMVRRKEREDEIKEYQKEYREDNKEKAKRYQKEYYKLNKEKYKKRYLENKEKKHE